MTAEIVIMNKRGVVASADSAGTVGNKTFNNLNKMFQLVSDKPIGILFFNNSEINGIPVEIIIKEYKANRRGSKLSTLKDCVNDFKCFLQDFIKQNMGSYDPLLGAFVDYLVSSDKLKYASYIDETLQNKPNIVKIRKTKKIRANVAKYMEARKQYISEQIKTQNLNLDKITDYFVRFVNKSDLCANFTGFAIFGYGDNDIYPKTYVFQSVGFVTNNIFKCFAEEAHESEQDIIQLAQKDMSDLFIFGLPHRLQANIKNIYNRVVAKLFLTIGDNKPEVKPIVEKALAECAEEVDKTITGDRINDLSLSLPHLSLTDLADITETLIKLECLKNRASLNIESVGGEVKTAILSKHEGFFWRNQKNTI